MNLQAFWPWALAALAMAVALGLGVVSLRQAAQAENLRRRQADLYDRRLSIYMAFHELLLAVAAKPDVIQELHRAAAARAQCRFLLNDAIGALLDDLMTQVLHLRARAFSDQDQRAQGPERAAQERLHRQECVHLLDRIDELAAAFEPVMKLDEP